MSTTFNKEIRGFDPFSYENEIFLGTKWRQRKSGLTRGHPF